MLRYIIAILVTIIIIWCVHYYFFSDVAKRRKARADLAKSCGAPDTNARNALIEFRAIERPRPEDNFLHGRLLRYNFLNGDPRTFTRDNPLVTEMTREYAAAANGLAARDADWNLDFVIRDMETLNNEFAARNIENAFTILFEGSAAKTKSIEQRKEIAAAESANKAEFIENYLDNSIRWTQDNQNVHDSKINSDLREIFAKLRGTYSGTSKAIIFAEAAAFIDENEEGRSAEYARLTLAKMAEGGIIGTYNTTEDILFSVTWDRTNYRENAQNSGIMKEAIVTALTDCFENGSMVCANGRCSRILNSLATIDYDETVAGAMTFEMYKNQIFNETKEIIEAEIEAAKKSSNDKMQALAASYESPNIVVDEDTEREFKKILESRIAQNVQSYRGKFSETEIAGLTRECIAAI